MAEQKKNAPETRSVFSMRMYDDQKERIVEIFSDADIKRKYHYLCNFVAEAVEEKAQRLNK
jgi:hypothetical protein